MMTGAECRVLLGLLLGIILYDCSALSLERIRLMTDPQQDFWEFMNAQPEVFIQCSSDGGKDYEIRSETIALNEDQEWVEGPWDVSKWLPEFGSMLYCQAYEDDSLVAEDSFFAFLNFRNEFVGDNILQLVEFESNDTIVPLTFYIRKELQDQKDGYFLEGVEAEFSCPECFDKGYPIHPYFASETAVWPVQVFEECTATQGPIGFDLLMQGFCCNVDQPSKLGDGICDEEQGYNTEVCGFDYGDCEQESELLQAPPSPGTLPNLDEQMKAPTPEADQLEETESVIQLNTVQLASVDDCTPILEILSDQPEFELFVSILNATGSIPSLESIKGYTLFIPTREALLSFIAGQQLTVDTLFQSEDILDILRTVVKLHILVDEQFQLVGTVLAEGGILIPTLAESQSVQLLQAGVGEVEIIPPNGAGAPARIIPDQPIIACEGIIYFIDNVLVPIFADQNFGL